MKGSKQTTIDCSDCQTDHLVEIVNGKARYFCPEGGWLDVQDDSQHGAAIAGDWLAMKQSRITGDQHGDFGMRDDSASPQSTIEAMERRIANPENLKKILRAGEIEVTPANLERLRSLLLEVGLRYHRRARCAK